MQTLSKASFVSVAPVLWRRRAARSAVSPALLLCLGLATAACSTKERTEEESKAFSRGSGSGPSAVTLTLTSPPSVPVLSPALLSSGSIGLRDRSEIVTGSAVAMGSGGVTVGVKARANDIWSLGKAQVRDYAKVRGTLHAAQRFIARSAQVAAFDKAPVFEPRNRLSWEVTFPSVSDSPAIVVAPHHDQTLAAGTYKSIVVTCNSTLTLGSGTYYLKRFVLESGASLVLDSSSGPVVMYVGDGGTFHYRGTVRTLSGDRPDWVVGYLGRNPVVLQNTFEGAFIAPSAHVTLGNPRCEHKGYFAARSLVLEPGVRVVYAPPLALIPASGGSGSNCAESISALVPPADLPAASARYCTGCGSPDDTDRDGRLDCLDGCPYDEAKTLAGMCGCGSVDTDVDGDGIANCLDECPNNANKSGTGQCGCPGQRGAKPVGSSCTDTGCPQEQATCNADGVCGDPTTCAPSAECKRLDWRGTAYWLCGTLAGGPAVGHEAAQQRCASKGLSLLRIDSPSENAALSKFLTQPVWLAANSLSDESTWSWSGPSSNGDDNFWIGSASGSRVGSRYVNWSAGAPAGRGRCALFAPKDGRWVDADCNQNLGYVCAYRTPLVVRPASSAPGTPRSLTISNAQCVDEATTLPGNEATLIRQIEMAEKGEFVGAAANEPPEGSTCFESPLANGLGGGEGSICEFVDIQADSAGCLQDEEETACKRYGAGFVCRQTQVNKDCVPTATQRCRNISYCGVIRCETEQVKCDDRVVCSPNSEVDAKLDPVVSDLAPSSLPPERLFQGGQLPSAEPSAEYKDLPTGEGIEHAWCRMRTQNPDSVPPAATPMDTKRGESGGGSNINIKFDPDLIFDVNVNPLALGENKMKLHAQAKLVAGVTLDDFLGQSYSADVIKAVADILVERCSMSTDATTFQVFGLDFIDPDDLPRINTNNPPKEGADPNSAESRLYNISQKCKAALDNYQVWAGRAKKAFRDAQQLLVQYRNLESLKQAFSPNFCESLGFAGANVPGFPGGAVCYPGETPEVVINRFIDYYQGPGSGQVSMLKDAASELSAVSAALRDALNQGIDLTFLDRTHQESQTIVHAQFAIGPVPMLLEIDLTASYGVAGKFAVDVQFPLQLDSGATPPTRVAGASVSVLPKASAALSAFVGAGFNAKVLKASVGIEGVVSLAKIQAPMTAGASLSVSARVDNRKLTADLGPPIAALSQQFQFSVPKSFNYFLSYNYGVGVDLQDVLAGELNGRVRVKFFFFSRTWRKRIVKFNGWSQHFDLLSGGSSPAVSVSNQSIPNTELPPDTANNIPVVEGDVPLGLSEPEVPLMRLETLTEQIPSLPDPDFPEAPVDAGSPALPTKAFDKSDLKKFFYDDLCCAKATEACSVSGFPQCCPDSNCVPTAGDLTAGAGTCQPKPVVCGAAGEGCALDNQCCTGLKCTSTGTCGACSSQMGPCQTDADCCQTAAVGSLLCSTTLGEPGPGYCRIWPG